jgi:DNA-binding NtrC family response regulator
LLFTETVIERGPMWLDSLPRVFVADDEPVIAPALAAILQMHGFSAKFFTSPLEALAATRENTADLRISDVDMPAMPGLDLEMQMKAQFPTCKILLFSGKVATLDRIEDARAQGHNLELLLKPVLPTEFLLEIGRKVSDSGAICAVYL